ncbi:MAG: hypothetical protein J4F47_09275 [Alphaproteobacteria bacterium]|nr:hypothetical protein [Alphaproteobacteria bacterium]
MPWSTEALAEFFLAGFQFTKPVGHARHMAAFLDGRDHGPDLLLDVRHFLGDLYRRVDSSRRQPPIHFTDHWSR